MSDFQKAVDYTLQNEAGFVSNPADRGGPTNWGITQETLARWRGRPVTPADVKALTREEACAIYKAYFWDPLGLTQVEKDSIAMAIFDIGVNRGLHASIRYAQQAANVPVDGVLGEKTLAAIGAAQPNPFLLRFICAVQRGYVEIAEKDTRQIAFLNGWITRSQRLMTLLEGIIL